MEEDLLKKKETEIMSGPLEPKKNNKVIIILLIIVVIGLLGYIVYDKIVLNNNTEETVKDNDNDNNKTEENNKEENKETEEETSTLNTPSSKDYYSNLAGKILKTKDGKKVLKIVSKSDKKTYDDAVKKDLIDPEEEDGNEDLGYFAYYNNNLLLIYDSSHESYNEKKELDSLKYMVISASDGSDSQCLESHAFVINKRNDMLLNIPVNREAEIYKVKDKYYFSIGDCASGFLPVSVYDENEKEIGDYFINSDDKGNIYILKDNIIKYDNTGNIVYKTNQKFDINDINTMSLVVDDTLYIISKIKEKTYLINVMTEEKYEIGSFDIVSPGNDLEPVLLRKENNTIIISVNSYNEENDEEVEKIIGKFDLTTKKYEKNN